MFTFCSHYVRFRCSLGCSLCAHKLLTECSCWADSRPGITIVGQCSDCKRTFLFFSDSCQTDHKLVSLGLAVGCDQDCLNEAQGTTKGCDHICSACNLCYVLLSDNPSVFISRVLETKRLKSCHGVQAVLTKCPAFRCCARHIFFICICAILQQQVNCCH